MASDPTRAERRKSKDVPSQRDVAPDADRPASLRVVDAEHHVDREPAARGPIPPAGGPGSDWRAAVATASGLNVLAGLWLIIAPFVLDYGSRDSYGNDIIFGGLVAFLALLRISGAYRESWMSYVNTLVGVWLFVAAFVVQSTARAAWNDVILGVIVFCLGLVSASASDDAYVERPWYRR